MDVTEKQTYSLENFNGPLDILLHLVKREEIDISDVTILQLVQQYIESSPPKDIDQGGTFVSMASWLMAMKGKALLRRDLELPPELEEDDTEPLAYIGQLLEYYRFKKISKKLSSCEEQQNQQFSRGSPEDREKIIPNGIDHISLQDLTIVLQGAMDRASQRIQPHITGEKWKVSEKIEEIRNILQQGKKVHLRDLFTSEKSKEELITIFLALLELIFKGEVKGKLC